jgi:SpoVK/Ycf46/Vps4 family AAA+-type ATPase
LNQVVEVPNCSWDDIGGLENVKRELQEVSELLHKHIDTVVSFLSSASEI